MIWQILIPTIKGREAMLDRLSDELARQIVEANYFGNVDLVVNHADGTIGEKRNTLLQNARADYVSFFDDDDMPFEGYVRSCLEGIRKGVDVCSLKGIITENGANPLVFEHSLRYDAYKTNEPGIEVRYERYPNHLNCMKASIAKRFRFPSISHGEDTDFATQINCAGVLTTEHYIEQPIYQYLWQTKPTK